MVSGGEAGGGGKKRKASSAAAEDIIITSSSPVARREPRRGLGVAELERIRVALEMAERCYAAAASSSLLSAPHQHHPTTPALPLVVHAAGVAASAPAHHQHVVNNGAVHHHHLQMTRGHLTPYCLAQHYYGNDSLTRLFTTNGGGHPSSHQNLHSSSHHQNLSRQANQIQIADTALPVSVMGQAASSESSSSASQRQGRPRRRAHAAKPGQTTAAALPQVAFVDLVDSDDDTAGADVQELDLELKL